MSLMSLFWANGGVLVMVSAWQAKDAALERQRTTSALENMSMTEWVRMPAEEHAALCYEWGGFTPPAVVLIGEHKRRQAA